jgi:hypothetical protein
MNRGRAIASFMLLLALTGLACGVPGFGESGPAPTPTPIGDTITFVIPAYTYTLRPGDTVPGARLQYVGRTGDSYDVLIDGLPATKRIGDSFIWQGVLAPGVYATYNLRITTAIFGTLPVAGPVEIIVFNPAPREVPASTEVNAPLHYSNIVINYSVPTGWQLPGATLVYEGISQQGEGNQTTRLALLSGLSGYPYLALGDSLVWMGMLRDNVVTRLNLRVTAINENSLGLAGTAELWITPVE